MPTGCPLYTGLCSAEGVVVSKRLHRELGVRAKEMRIVMATSRKVVWPNVPIFNVGIYLPRRSESLH